MWERGTTTNPESTKPTFKKLYAPCTEYKSSLGCWSVWYIIPSCVFEIKREIIENSKVRLFLVNDKNQLAKYLKKNMYGKKIVIGMGAGSISNWMRQLPKLM